MKSNYPSNNQRKNVQWKLESYPSDFSKCDLTGSEGVSWLEYIKVKKSWTGLQRGNVFNCGSGARRASCWRDFCPRNQDSSKTSKPRWTAGWCCGELVSLPTTTVGHSAKWPEFKHSSSLLGLRAVLQALKCILKLQIGGSRIYPWSLSHWLGGRH